MWQNFYTFIKSVAKPLHFYIQNLYSFALLLKVPQNICTFIKSAAKYLHFSLLFILYLYTTFGLKLSLLLLFIDEPKYSHQQIYYLCQKYSHHSNPPNRTLSYPYGRPQRYTLGNQHHLYQRWYQNY